MAYLALARVAFAIGTMLVRDLNAVMTADYWKIAERRWAGRERRVDYGELLVERLAIDLTRQFGRILELAFGKRAFFQAWPEKQILSPPLKELDGILPHRVLGSHDRSMTSMN